MHSLRLRYAVVVVHYNIIVKKEINWWFEL